MVKNVKVTINIENAKRLLKVAGFSINGKTDDEIFSMVLNTAHISGLTNVVVFESDLDYPMPNGTLKVYESTDTDYPGLDIEFESTQQDFDSEPVTNPRICIEQPINDMGVSEHLRALIWADPHNEDYTNKIEF